ARIRLTPFVLSVAVIPKAARLGSIVSGWMAYFNADNMSSVTFRYQSTSTNFPNRTLSTSLNIQ
ncbi:DUF4879 domain-containing protein, partial [Dickeya dadantii]|uniref:DUF4879 domain-containing protein n=1 Tax=Dickeya dadantii TaxID=204038 RepID=UPI0020A62EB2